jgi:hypothetical protein
MSGRFQRFAGLIGVSFVITLRYPGDRKHKPALRSDIRNARLRLIQNEFRKRFERYGQSQFPQPHECAGPSSPGG